MEPGWTSTPIRAIIRCMIRTLVLLPLAACISSAAISPEQARSAAASSLGLLQRSASVFVGKMPCFSCHHQGLGTMAARMAQERGIDAGPDAAKVALHGLTSPISIDPASIDKAVQANYLIDPSMADGSALMAAYAAGVKPSLSTAVYARRIGNWQEADGHWTTLDARPPHSYSFITATAVAVRAISLYYPPRLSAERDLRIAKAATWLSKTKVRSTEDATFRLLGLLWASAPSGDARQALLNLQRSDGGWSQTPQLASDAYSTGQAIYALSQAAGMKLTDPHIEAAVGWLLRTQKPDGSWLVESRQRSPATVSPPFFESEFPHGKNQYISAAATAWGAMGLMSVVPKTVQKPAALVADEAVAVKGEQPWMSVALFGTAADLTKLLDGGLGVNAHSDGGTSMLMMAAPDPAKVKLLLERGADASAKAKSGFTALFVASMYRGNVDAVRQLIAKGAPAKIGEGVMFGSSPLYYAAAAGDPEIVQALLENGADPNRKTMVMGMFPASPITAALTGSARVIPVLAKHGAAVDEKDPDGLNLVASATLAHRPDVVRALAKAGADVNSVDKFGWTPLLYAATVDFGDADVVEALLAAGADAKKTSPDGKSPLSQAKLYNPNALAVLKR